MEIKLDAVGWVFILIAWHMKCITEDMMLKCPFTLFPVKKKKLYIVIIAKGRFWLWKWSASLHSILTEIGTQVKLIRKQKSCVDESLIINSKDLNDIKWSGAYTAPSKYNANFSLTYIIPGGNTESLYLFSSVVKFDIQLYHVLLLSGSISTSYVSHVWLPHLHLIPKYFEPTAAKRFLALRSVMFNVQAPYSLHYHCRQMTVILICLTENNLILHWLIDTCCCHSEIIVVKVIHLHLQCLIYSYYSKVNTWK